MATPRPAFNAVILGAGVGSRLGPLTADRPKALLPLADGGDTFLDHSLRCLQGTPVRQVHVVGGHAFAALEAHVAARWGDWLRRGVLVLRRFPDFRTVNNIGTLYFARAAFVEPCLLLNSDIVYHPAILRRALEHMAQEADQSFMVVDGSVDLAEEEMKVAVGEEGFLRAVSKRLAPAESAGEYIGILYLTPADADVVLSAAADLLAAGRTDLYYEDVIHSVLDRIRLRPLFIDGLPWTEVDTVEDYQRARALYSELKRDAAGGSHAHH
ncbi:phosphocholine cytidylyltransferase family protein [Thermaerobacter sp. FW80]|uniref:phosphocholine cytidylyltransferase family protein n=1 Tax=Thermaerobacter sp. FW80 TaxID=2546351 RepID=UPI001074DDC8|nr:phosphocholine cytidylyltransferase family protein [Thermaerobacter sp. FW80]QBS37573.1 phosphocholine cytidylyltransferase family protein [Thermaerobacter sp. FW80]